MHGIVELEDEALLDTGFDGEVVLPTSMLGDLGLPESTGHWILADGSSAISITFLGEAQISGVGDTMPVTVHVIGSEVMVGRRLIESYRVILDHGREVIVEP